jgi:hypothetical protein
VFGGGSSTAGAGGRGPSAGGMPGGAASLSSALVSALKADAGSYRWVAATSGSQSAASIELATGEPVMAIGGFSGQGGELTLAQFQQYVARGQIHYYLASGGGGMGGPGGGRSTSSITSWVQAHFKAQTIGGETVYDLSR